ncbi:hypothetical protein M011DRAFT_74101 [Sporormia fimetaria CBS 119925]|uniref:Uncharacterized protein n=1 Tax=Sporormia fimetaria CBS 119925 TaxID=1340428 RepID=A0A6A6VBX0_9PLEO|nr:hypothetical protein M011DRAFT_74101 [Sporormia fimetaria CBS 119925]
MVTTRGHPREFPPPEASPMKSVRRSTRRSTASPVPEELASPSPQVEADSKTVSRQAISVNGPTSTSTSSLQGWSHTASNVTIAWLLISVPLQLWDALYILLRPHTMAGGKLQWPIWKPYEIYAAMDYVYGWPGWNDKDGFGGAQGVLNAVEVVLYGLYIMIVMNHGVPSAGGKGAQIGEGVGGWVAGGRRIAGKRGNRALLIGFSAAVMTLSKTVLYMFNEYFCDFNNIKHNNWQMLVFYYTI